MSRIFAVCVLSVLCLCARAADVHTARLGELLAGMRRIEAVFNQQLKDEKGTLLQGSGGRVLLAHPGRFRWETDPPFAQLVVSDGTTVWQYDPDLAQVVSRPLDQRADQIPSMLLAGEIDAVEKLYSISASGDDAGAERFELLPHDDGSPFSRLALQFRAGLLERLEITDGLGQRTEVSFSAVRVPDAIAVERFRFVTPEGVDEIHDD